MESLDIRSTDSAFGYLPNPIIPPRGIGLGGAHLSTDNGWQQITDVAGERGPAKATDIVPSVLSSWHHFEHSVIGRGFASIDWPIR